MHNKSGANVKFKMSYLLIGCSEFGGELLPQLVQLLLENRLLLLQREALPLKLLLQLLRKPIRDTNLSEQVSDKSQRAFDKELQWKVSVPRSVIHMQVKQFMSLTSKVVHVLLKAE